MRWVFFVVLSLILPLGALAWWQRSDDFSFVSHVSQKPLEYSSPSQMEDWRALIPPRVLSVTPTRGSVDVLVGIEDPIVVQFESSTKSFFIDFSFEPPVAVTYENNADKTEFRILPETPLQDSITYTLTISYRKRLAPQGMNIQLAQTNFTTLPAAPVTWSADLVTRLAEAKKFTRPSISTGKYIDINLKSQVMTIFEGGKLVDAFIISSGKPGMDTPKGQYAIHNKALRPWSKRYELYMPYWMAITADGKYGIHELPEWPGGYKEGANHLGRPVSHGCVRLGISSAQRVYDWTVEGTPVIVY